MATTCDVPLGACFRELGEQERNHVALLCSSKEPLAVTARDQSG